MNRNGTTCGLAGGSVLGSLSTERCYRRGLDEAHAQDKGRSHNTSGCPQVVLLGSKFSAHIGRANGTKSRALRISS